MLSSFSPLFLVPFFVAILSSLLLIKTAPRTRLLDFPDGIRKTHSLPTPTAGGIAIALAFFSGLPFFPGNIPQWFFYTAFGSLLLLAMGVIDDRFHLSAPAKLSVQIIAASFSLIPFLPSLNPGDSLPRNFALLAMMGLFLLTITNGYNLIDGIDGLSASLAILSAGLLIIFISMTSPPLLFHLLPLSVLLIASLLGFLFFNLPPAQLFLGDSGSHFTGFLIACLWLPLAVTSHLGAVAAVSANLLPIADVIDSVRRRSRSGVSIFQPDRQHIHFRALERLRTPSLVTLVFLVGTMAFFTFFTFIKKWIGE